MTFWRLLFFLIFSSEPVASFLIFSISTSRSSSSSSFLMPSAPISATNSSPYSTRLAS